MRYLATLALLVMVGCGGEVVDAEKVRALSSNMTKALERIGTDPTFTAADLEAAKKDVDELVKIAEEHEGALSAENLAKVKGVREFLGAASIGNTEVDAATGAAAAVDLEAGHSVRVDITGGEWTARKDVPEFPNNAGVGYPDWTPGPKDKDTRACENKAYGALVARAGGNCFDAGKWYMYSGDKDALKLEMNDTEAADNAGKLQVRWAVLRKPMP